MNDAERAQLDKVQRRFTTTAEPFAQFVLSRRASEAQLLAEMAMEGLERAENSTALDVACGPGTLTLALAALTKRVVGLDITPRMLLKARQAAEEAGFGNLLLLAGDASALPFGEGSFDIVLCGYALHHLLEPGLVMRCIAGVVRRGGRVGIVDMLVPDRTDRNAVNHIERTRDASHTTTLDRAALHGLFAAEGLRVLATETKERHRDFDDWMQIAGLRPGMARYEDTRRLMEASIAGDTAGYQSRVNEDSGALEFVQTSLLLVAEKA